MIPRGWTLTGVTLPVRSPRLCAPMGHGPSAEGLRRRVPLGHKVERGEMGARMRAMVSGSRQVAIAATGPASLGAGQVVVAEGGNAVDAAIAAAITSMSSE